MSPIRTRIPTRCAAVRLPSRWRVDREFHREFVCFVAFSIRARARHFHSVRAGAHHRSSQRIIWILSLSPALTGGPNFFVRLHQSSAIAQSKDSNGCVYRSLCAFFGYSGSERLCRERIMKTGFGSWQWNACARLCFIRTFEITRVCDTRLRVGWAWDTRFEKSRMGIKRFVK